MNACLWYTKATVEISFPENNVRCALCPLLETYARKQCRRTGEYILDDRVTGMWCPLNIIPPEEVKPAEEPVFLEDVPF